MTTATVCTWERTGRDARAPFALASEHHFDLSEQAAVDHVDGVLARYLDAARAVGLRVAYYHHDNPAAVLARPATCEVDRVVTYAYWPDCWTAGAVAVLVAQVENSAPPVTPNRRN